MAVFLSFISDPIMVQVTSLQLLIYEEVALPHHNDVQLGISLPERHN